MIVNNRAVSSQAFAGTVPALKKANTRIGTSVTQAVKTSRRQGDRLEISRNRKGSENGELANKPRPTLQSRNLIVQTYDVKGRKYYSRISQFQKNLSRNA